MSTSHADPAPQMRPALFTARFAVWSIAISNGLLSLFPLTFIGAVLLAVLQAPWLETALQGTTQDMLERLLHATTSFMGLACAMMIATRVAEQDDRALETAAPPAIAAVAAALFILGTSLDSPSPNTHTSGMGYSQLFRGIVTGIVAAELMLCFSRLLPRIDIAKSLDTENNLSLYAAMRLTLTACGTLLVFLLILLACEQAQPGLQAALTAVFEGLLAHPDVTPVLRYSLFALMNQALWTFGINGGQLLLAISNQGSDFVAAPDLLYSSTLAAPMFINTFAHLGGAGATWGLIVAILVGIKDPVLRRMALLSIFPAIFNVNELLMFGIPIVFGRALLLPFLLTPPLLIIVPTLLAESGLLSLSGQQVSWSTPALLSGYLITGSAAGVVLQLLGISLSALVYFPFLKKLQAERKAVLRNSLQEALATLCDAQPVSPSSLRRRDNTGTVSRALLRDFLRDLQTPNVSLHYQPQHDSKGHVVGFEALLRWTHADYGPIPTQAIINIVEEADKISMVGDWVLQRACRDMASWRRSGMDAFKLSVNVSPLELEQPDYACHVMDTFKRYGLRAGKIALEITEGRMLGSTGLINLRQLELKKVPLSMDDFGAGCTSLLYLQHYRMHTIKLDRQITHCVESNPVNQEVIRAIARLSASQGALLVAEYVDSPGQQQLLESLGCDWFQGWLYSKAMPACDVPDYVRQHTPSLSAQAAEMNWQWRPTAPT